MINPDQKGYQKSMYKKLVKKPKSNIFGQREKVEFILKPPPIFDIRKEIKGRLVKIESLFDPNFKNCDEVFSRQYMEDMEIDPKWKVSECSGKDYAEKFLASSNSI